MKLSDTHDGSNDPFEGDKTLLWTSLPSGAKVNKARLTLTPAQVAGGTLFQETIRFQDGQGDWNATKATGRNGNRYVEIDFHNRRTLSSVIGTDLDITTDSTHLLVDMGGVFVEISAQGAVKTPTDPSRCSAMYARASSQCPRPAAFYPASLSPSFASLVPQARVPP